jgi:hypothetical protein
LAPAGDRSSRAVVGDARVAARRVALAGPWAPGSSRRAARRSAARRRAPPHPPPSNE